MDEVIDELRQSVARNPGRADLRVQLGDALIEAGEIAEAASQYQQAVVLQPKDVGAVFGLGRVALKKRDYRGASAFFRQASQRQPDWAPIFFHWAMALRGLGDVEGAKRLQKHSFELSVKEVRRRNKKAGNLIAAGKFEEALKELKAAKAVSPRSTITHVNIGAALRGMGRLREAREFFKRAVSLGPDLFEAQYNHGLQLFSDNDYEGALAHFQRASDLKPEDPFSRNAMGNVMVRLGRTEEALALFLSAAERKADFAEAWNGAGEVLLTQERPREAAPHLQYAIDSKPDFLRARMNLARALERLGDEEGASLEYQEIIKRDSRFTNAHIAMAKQEMAREDAAAAIGLLENGLKHCPDSAEMYLLLARAYMIEEEHQQSVWAATQATERRKNYFEAWRFLAEARVALEDNEGASQAIQKAISLKPSDTRAIKRLGEILSADNQEGEAEEVLRGLLKKEPGDLDAAQKLAAILVERDDIAGTLEVLESAAKAGSPDSELMVKIAEFCLQDRKFDKAIAWTERAMTSGLDGARLRWIRARAHEAIDEKDLAMDEYLMAIYLDGELHEARISYGILLIENERFEEGLNEIQTGLSDLGEDEGKNVEALCALGIGFKETGRADVAVRILSKALEAESGLGRVHNLLADAYHQIDDQETAWTHAQIASEKGHPLEPELSDKIRRALEGRG
ncbi:MAG: tetratricopeptide repeat protein [Planctomycetota bacterium]|jgi:tetratricopeptide (TPR) repeat protein